MASLHGELAAQQRELDEGKERDQRNARQKKELNVRLDEKEAELGRVKGERRNLEARVTVRVLSLSLPFPLSLSLSLPHTHCSHSHYRHPHLTLTFAFLYTHRTWTRS